MRTGASSWIAALALVAAASTATPVRSAELFRADSFSVSGVPGLADVGFEGFDPALGTLDRVVVNITGTLQFGIFIPAGGAITPIVDFDAFGLGSGFEFAGTGARFLFAPQVNGSGEPLSRDLTEVFSLDFTFNSLSDLTGFAAAHPSGSPAPLLPPTSVNGQRADFISAFGVLEDFLFTPAGFSPDFPFSGGGSIFVTFDFSPTPPATVISEPASSLPVFGLALVAVILRRQQRGWHGQRRNDGGA